MLWVVGSFGVYGVGIELAVDYSGSTSLPRNIYLLSLNVVGFYSMHWSWILVVHCLRI